MKLLKKTSALIITLLLLLINFLGLSIKGECNDYLLANENLVEKNISAHSEHKVYSMEHDNTGDGNENHRDRVEKYEEDRDRDRDKIEALPDSWDPDSPPEALPDPWNPGPPPES